MNEAATTPLKPDLQDTAYREDADGLARQFFRLGGPLSPEAAYREAPEASPPYSLLGEPNEKGHRDYARVVAR